MSSTAQTPTSSASAATTDLVFWDPSGYHFNSATDWNQWRYVSDGLGGKIGIRYGVMPGFGTFNWDSFGGKAPVGSLGDGFGTISFGKNEMTGYTAKSVNSIRMQTNTQFTAAQNSYTIELDFSQYKGSAAGGKDGVAGAHTFIGVSDIYAGLTYAKTVVTITGTHEDGSAASPDGWTLVNGGTVPPSGAGNQPSAQLSLTKGVLQGTNKPAPGGAANSIDTVMGLVRLDAAGYKTLHLRYDISPVGGNRSPRTDNSGLYVATVVPHKAEPPKAEPHAAEPPKAEPHAAEPPKAEPPKAEPHAAEPPKAEPPKAETPSHSEPAKSSKGGNCAPAAPTVPSHTIADSRGKGAGAKTSYTFTTRNPDGSIAGKGCFTYETPADGGAPKLAAFYYSDKTIGTIDQSHIQTFQFNQDEKGANRFAFVAASPTERLCSLHADTSLSAQLTGIGNEGPQSYQGKTVDFPKLAESSSVTEESTTVPAVDLVVVIDSSVSMKDEADSLSKAVAAAIESAKTKCPSDLRVTYLGIEGTFKNTLFDTTIKNYLTGTVKADETALRGRKRGSVAGGGAQEDGGRAIEDVAGHFDWRPEAKRAIFYLGDEAFEGGGADVDKDDVESANRAIALAKEKDVRVHTYLGTSGAKEKQRKALEGEYARVASETGGQAFTAQDALNGFQALLEKVICGSKQSKTTTTEFCCCQEYVEK